MSMQISVKQALMIGAAFGFTGFSEQASVAQPMVVPDECEEAAEEPSIGPAPTDTVAEQPATNQCEAAVDEPATLPTVTDTVAEQEPGEIVVTAQRRSQLARDVPISVTAVGSEAIQNANITNIGQIETLVPGLKIVREGLFTHPAIRGVSPNVTNVGLDPNVSIYVDGVYQPSSTGNTFDLPDIERIEVLKGPQGTLFGRNSTGGTIRVITMIPSYDLNGRFAASYGNFDDFGARGYVNIPVIEDRVALSLTGYYHRNDTYYNDIRPGGSDIGPDDSRLVRARLRLDPTDNLQIILTGLLSRRRESVAIYGNTVNGNSVARLLDPNALIPSRPWDVALSDAAEPQVVKSRDVSASIEWDLPGVTISSITSYLDRSAKGGLDADFAYTPNGLGVNYFPEAYDKYFGEELTATTDLNGPLNFIVGGYYTKGRSAYNPLGVQTPEFGVSIYGTQRVEAVAGFVEGNWDITDRLTAIAGVRYSWERRKLAGDTVFGYPAAKPDPLTEIGARSWDSFTPRFSLRYELTPTSNVYFTYSEGFKSGIFNTNNTAMVDVADPETIRSYEVGYKGRIGHSLTLEAAAFYYDYKDLQVTILTSVDGIPISRLQNAASARIYGGEFDLAYQFSPAFDIRAAATWLPEATYREFPNAIINLPCTTIAAPGMACSTVGDPLNIGNTNVIFDASGERLIRAPRLSASFTANGHGRLGNGDLEASATLYYSSRYDFTVGGRINQPAYATIDARIAWSPDNTGLTLAAFGRNLTENSVIAAAFISEVSDGVSWAPPRTYGVEIGYRF